MRRAATPPAARSRPVPPASRAARSEARRRSTSRSVSTAWVASAEDARPASSSWLTEAAHAVETLREVEALLRSLRGALEEQGTGRDLAPAAGAGRRIGSSSRR